MFHLLCIYDEGMEWMDERCTDVGPDTQDARIAVRLAMKDEGVWADLAKTVVCKRKGPWDSNEKKERRAKHKLRSSAVRQRFRPPKTRCRRKNEALTSN